MFIKIGNRRITEHFNIQDKDCVKKWMRKYGYRQMDITQYRVGCTSRLDQSAGRIFFT